MITATTTLNACLDVALNKSVRISYRATTNAKEIVNVEILPVAAVKVIALMR